MKNDLITLIDSVDEIEKLFHNSGGNGLPKIQVIYDVQAFQDWLQEVRLELQDIYDRTKDHFILETLNEFNERMNGWSDKRIFSGIKSKLKAIRKNIDRYYLNKTIEQERLLYSRALKFSDCLTASTERTSTSYENFKVHGYR